MRAGERSVAQLSRLLLTAQRVPSLKGNWQGQECCAPPAAAVPKAAVLGLSCEPQTCTIIRSFQLEQILQISTSNHHAALPHPITKQCSWCHVRAPLKYLHRLPGQPIPTFNTANEYIRVALLQRAVCTRTPASPPPTNIRWRQVARDHVTRARRFASLPFPPPPAGSRRRDDVSDTGRTP